MRTAGELEWYKNIWHCLFTSGINNIRVRPRGVALVLDTRFGEFNSRHPDLRFNNIGMWSSLVYDARFGSERSGFKSLHPDLIRTGSSFGVAGSVDE